MIFDISNYELERPHYLKKKNLKIGLMKDKLRRKIMAEIAALKAKNTAI